MLTRRSFFKSCFLAGTAVFTGKISEIIAMSQNRKPPIAGLPSDYHSCLSLTAMAHIHTTAPFLYAPNSGLYSFTAYCFALSGGGSLMDMEMHYTIESDDEEDFNNLIRDLPVGSNWIFSGEYAVKDKNTICLYDPVKKGSALRLTFVGLGHSHRSFTALKNKKAPSPDNIVD